VPKYKSVKGDPIDEMMGVALAKANINLKVARTSPGKYIFGTKTIMCKIVNGNLLVRVGGGYMGVDEFIKTYGPLEIAKLFEAEENKMTIDENLN
jgi:hypothetical protein